MSGGHKHLFSLVCRLYLQIRTVDLWMVSREILGDSSNHTIWRGFCIEQSRESWFCWSAGECILSIRNQACSLSCRISIHERSCNGHSRAWTLWNQSWLCKRQSGCKGKAVLGYSTSQPLSKMLVLNFKLTIVSVEELYSISSWIAVIAWHTWANWGPRWIGYNRYCREGKDPLYQLRALWVLVSREWLKEVKIVTYIFESP